MTDTIEGRNPLLEALKSGRPISKILLAKDMPRHSTVAEILNLAQSQSIPVEYIERRILDQKSQTTASQGVIAYAAAKEYVDLDELFAISRQKNEPPLYVVLDGIEDPYNLGAIIRSAEATGVHGIIIRARREVGLTATVVKASAGAIEYVPVARVVNIAQTIETLRQNNVWVIGIDMSGEQQYSRVDFKLPTAIVIGGEGKGLADLTRKRCDSLAFIPMKGKITSLNASIAAAVVMYEALKQRSE